MNNHAEEESNDTDSVSLKARSKLQLARSLRSQLLALIAEGDDNSSIETITTFVADHPDSVKELDPETGRTVLHDAVASPASRDVIALLVKLHPEGATAQDNAGQLALHIAASAVPHQPEILRWLIHNHSNNSNKTTAGSRPLFLATQVKDSQGWLALHWAMYAGRWEAATLLLNSHQGRFTAQQRPQVGTKKRPILQFALKSGAPEDFARLLVKKCPECLEWPDSVGDLPLHSILIQNPPREINLVVELLLAYPVAAQVLNDSNDLPLHTESQEAGRLQVIQALLAEYPNAISVEGNGGYLPLQRAVYNVAIEPGSLDLLYSVNPGALDKVDHQGDSLLHLAVSPNFAGTSETTVRWVLEHCPKLAFLPNKHGDHALHYAARDRAATAGCLELLIESDPAAAQRMNNLNGNLALHGAMAAEPTARHVFAAYPAGVHRANTKGQLPLHTACRNSAPLAVVKFLVARYSVALQIHDNKGNLPFHYAIFAKDSATIAFLMNASGDKNVPLTKTGTHPLLFVADPDVSIDVAFWLVQRWVFENKPSAQSQEVAES